MNDNSHMYLHIVAVVGQMCAWSEYRTRYKLDASAFGKFDKLVSYLVSCGSGGVLPSKLKEAYPDAFKEVM
jgi:hypothetical protein